MDLSPSIDFHKKNSSRVGHLTIQHHSYLPLLLKLLITFLQYAKCIPESSVFPLTLWGFVGCCGGYVAAGCWTCPQVHGQGWRGSSSLQKQKYWKTNNGAPILGVRNPMEGAGRLKEWLGLVLVGFAGGCTVGQGRQMPELPAGSAAGTHAG